MQAQLGYEWRPKPIHLPKEAAVDLEAEVLRTWLTVS
jgi:hypothetical protein